MPGPPRYSPGYYSLMRGLNNPDITGAPYANVNLPSWYVPGNPQQSYQNLLGAGNSGSGSVTMGLTPQQNFDNWLASNPNIDRSGYTLQNPNLVSNPALLQSQIQQPSQSVPLTQTATQPQVQAQPQMSAIDPFTTYMFGLNPQQQYQPPQNMAQYNAFGTTYGETQDPLSTYQNSPGYGGVPYMTSGMVYGGVPYA